MTAPSTAKRCVGTLKLIFQGQGGVVCVKTKQAVLVGVYDEPVQPGEATKVVEGLADYLISVNYVRFLRFL